MGKEGGGIVCLGNHAIFFAFSGKSLMLMVSCFFKMMDCCGFEHKKNKRIGNSTYSCCSLAGYGFGQICRHFAMPY